MEFVVVLVPVVPVLAELIVPLVAVLVVVVTAFALVVVESAGDVFFVVFAPVALEDDELVAAGLLELVVSLDPISALDVEVPDAFMPVSVFVLTPFSAPTLAPVAGCG